jgi:hypothetical protein
MKIVSWLIVNPNGVKSVRKTRPYLEWNEIAIKVNIDVPKELFERPSLEATIKVDELPNNAYQPDIIIDTVDLIEQQTGAKINFKVLPTDDSQEQLS